MPNGQQTGFDANAARQAGYSDDEILNHLASKRNFDVSGALNAGYSKADIITHLSQTPQPSGEQKLSRTLQNMTYAMSGQSDQMHPDDKAEFDRGVKAGAKSAAVTTATGAASAAAAPLTAPVATGTEAVGTGILDATGHEIMRDVTTYGPSVARQVFSHPLTQSLLTRVAGYAGAGYILKMLGVLGK
jgi:hypothetical protein